VLFLLVFFCMFYCGTQEILIKLIWMTLIGTIALYLFMFSGLAEKISLPLPYPGDFLTIVFIGWVIYSTYRQINSNAALMIKFKRSLIIAFVAPFTIGIIFKYFLLVPMPFEGLIVALLDAVWYADFWS